MAPNGTKYLNDVPIIGPDFLISTGVLHVIDRILDVNRTDARPGFTSNHTTTEPTPAAVPSSSHVSSLSTAAKAGIGVGVGVGAIVAISLVVWWCMRRARSGTQSPAAEVKPIISGPVDAMGRPLRGKYEMSVVRSGGQEWEMDGVEPQRPRRLYEME